MIRTYFSKHPNIFSTRDKTYRCSLYHMPEWFSVLQDGFGVSTGTIVSERESEVIAALPVFYKKKFGIRLCGSPLRGTFTEFTGPWFRDGLEKEDEAQIFLEQVQTLKRMNFSYIEIGVDGGQARHRGDMLSNLGAEGFAYQQRPSLLVDLSVGIDSVWDKFQGRARNMIRKAEKNGVICQVEQLDGPLIEEYYGLVSSTFQRQNLAMPHPIEAYFALPRHLEENGNIMFISARKDGILVSGGVFLIDRHRMVFHSGSSTKLGYDLAASSLVQWAAINEGHSRGLIGYDLGGIGVDSIDKFKQSFGGTPIYHHRSVFTSNFLKRGTRFAHWLASKGILRVFD
ncbi:peptidoglycan bridge formation glycyltransferase FemA/FemB family protein [Paracoccaceae bacterium]|nr:peptidoglycan bridge formation glycyltransferase FemA/FemB family protein [Paracoccaceae bacterium]